MNEKNFDYLKDQVKYTGFGETLENDLKGKLQMGSPEFQIYHNAKFGNDSATATLYFKKSDQSDMYFFNKYDLTLKQESRPDIMKQTFYINKGNNITVKEAYNLMSGRAVNKDLTNKDGQVYNAWIQLDFKETDKNGNYQLRHYHSNYGFDLEKELAKHPLKELTNEQDKTRLIESLQKGNRQSLTFINDGNEQKVFIEANPRFKTIDVFDTSMQRVHNQSKKDKVTPDQSVNLVAIKETHKQGDDDSKISSKVLKKKTRNKKQSLY
jgi:hypothetical protein